MNQVIALILQALVVVESGNQVNAIGDDGNAWGCLQIQQVCLDDVNRVYKTKYTRKDCFTRKKSYEIATKYLTYYGKQYQKNTGKKPTVEVLVRIWNGGPKGYKKSATRKYWLRANEQLVAMNLYKKLDKLIARHNTTVRTKA